ncbi:MAG: serine/threonine protein kinase [Micrococcales bacterium]|nr:serine/threonine protein kinase [Micrococcales bacterium]
MAIAPADRIGRAAFPDKRPAVRRAGVPEVAVRTAVLSTKELPVSQASQVQGTRVLGGRFEPLGPLAQGGHGILTLARDLSTGETVVVKSLRPEFTANVQVRRLFQTEAAVGMEAIHPALPRTIDYLEVGQGAHLVKEYAPGEPLSAIVRQRGAMGCEPALIVVAHIARGLAALHQAGWVHRDVSPGNIVWDGEQARLIDFGIAIRAGAPGVTADLRVPGNPEYLAPELSLGRAVTPAADIYSLGLVLFHAVTGERPFLAATPEDTATAHVMRKPPAPPACLPLEVRLLVEKMIDRDPERRPAHAGVVASCFEEYAQ